MSLRRVNQGPRRWVLCRLAVLDLWRDRTISLCMVAAVVAVVAPLLLLFGLKNGVVAQMRSELAKQPDHLEIRMLGHHQLESAWIERLAQDPRVSFVMPLTRALNATADVRVSASAHVSNVELIPTGTGDPLVGNREPLRDDAHVWLSHALAMRLGVQTDAQLQLIVTRQQHGQVERLRVPVVVQGVLAPSAFSRQALLVSLPLLVALEDFRDGAAWPAPGELVFTGQGLHRDHYPRVRLYAQSMDQVASLSADLQAQGYDTVSRLADIEAMQSIDRLLNVVFGVIAWLAVAGGMACLLGAFMANIDRKRRDLALLRLFGYARRALLAYIVVQGLVVAGIGYGLGLALYRVGSAVFDVYLRQAFAQGHEMSQLSGEHLLVSAALAIGLTFLIACLGGGLAMRIAPNESLRDHST